MIKDITYSGISTVPSDYEAPDGQLNISLNLISEDRQLKTLTQPKVIKQLSQDDAEGIQKICFIHKTASFTHYILYNEKTSRLYWMNETSGLPKLIEDVHISSYSFSHINAVGNTLLVFSEQEIRYLLWKDGNYNDLGNHLPNIELSFGLIGRPRFYSVSDDSKKTFNISFNGISEGELYNTWSEENKTKITEQVMAKVNKFLREQSVTKGRFALPFLVRYALRLYDGTLVCHSAPILMNPSTNAAPIVMWKHAWGKKTYTDAELDIMLVASTLDYKLCSDPDYDYLNLKKDWSDIIKSVDVFISKPIYTWDQNGQCSSFSDADNFQTKFIGRIHCDGVLSNGSAAKEDWCIGPISIGEFNNRKSDKTGFDKLYIEWTFSQLYSLFNSSDRTYPSVTINLPEFSDEKVRENIQDTYTFYKLCSINIDELSTSDRKEIVVGDEYLQSLVTREVMTDDYLTHDRLAADYSYTFNSRLNLSGVKHQLFRGFTPASIFCFVNHSRITFNANSDSRHTFLLYPTLLDYIDVTITVYIKENGENYSVTASSPSPYYLSGEFTQTNSNTGQSKEVKGKHSWGVYMFYPNVNAYKMVIRDYSGIYAVDLKPHDFLNGAYALLDYELERNTMPYPNIPTNFSNNNWISVPNKVYTSEVNNPFYFPLLGINTVGSGSILGICSAAKALSEGQFGQFPLYAFTSDGVWALETSANGTYPARQPITRDVCINVNSITQLDSSVLFATTRGLMLISGSNVQCISDAINNETPFDAQLLPNMDKLHAILGHNVDTCIPTIPFTEFLEKCGILYDYVHQRIIIYHPEKTYAYVFSLKSKEWGMMYSNILAGINSYPDALAVDKDYNLVNFALHSEKTQIGLAITRPLKLDAPDILKTVDTVIQRGHFRRGHVQSILYGSRDLFNWHLVWSSKDHCLRGFRGTPYKYFRIALICNLAPDESIYGASLQFTPRQTNRPH